MPVSTRFTQCLNISVGAQKYLETGAKELKTSSFAARLWAKDAALWKSEPEHRAIIANSLGWLSVPRLMLDRADELARFADEARREFTQVMVLGMGGSSLAPEVFSKLFPSRPGYPKLSVLDSTDPGWVARMAAEIDVKKTLFIFSSKSGGTVEPNSFFKYFYEQAERACESPAKNFVAVTDPGTSLEKFASGLNFRKIFLNPSDIGGRFSALSLFGLVPAAVSGVDVKTVLSRAVEMGEACRAETDLTYQNPGVWLGAVMGAAAKAGKDKLTLLCAPEMQSFGLWVEQLVAESTGKEGLGIVPIAGEEHSANYGPDRIFVHIKTPFLADKSAAALASRLSAQGRPVITVEMPEASDLGAQYFLWETATAAAGALLRINPFDQPNVQEAKALAQSALKELANNKEAPFAAEMSITPSRAACETLCGANIPPDELVKFFISLIKPGDYAGILAYLDGSPEADAALARLRGVIGKKSGAATLFGYGPRYLHSTGQLHKGGANNGVFLIFTAAPKKDIPVPTASYTFAQLEYAQAEGDFKALDEKGRRALRVHLGAQPVKVLSEIARQ